jgi:hypothetical protein
VNVQPGYGLHADISGDWTMTLENAWSVRRIQLISKKRRSGAQAGQVVRGEIRDT